MQKANTKLICKPAWRKYSIAHQNSTEHYQGDPLLRGGAQMASTEVTDTKYITTREI